MNKLFRICKNGYQIDDIRKFPKIENTLTQKR